MGGGGGGERKEARAPPCVSGGKNNNNWAMDTKFNAPTVNFILFLFCLVFCFVCLFNSFYKYIVLK